MRNGFGCAGLRLHTLPHSLTHLSHLMTIPDRYKPRSCIGSEGKSSRRCLVVCLLLLPELGFVPSTQRIQKLAAGSDSGLPEHTSNRWPEGTTMSETAVWTDRVSGSPVDVKSSPPRRAVLISALVLLLGIGASAWMY